VEKPVKPVAAKPAKKAEPAPEIKAVRFEVGKTLSKDEKSEVLKSIVDVYKGRAEKEFKGMDSRGEEKYGYAYSPDLFVKSDITGKMLRHYITLPNGKIAHPTELFPDITQAEVDRAVAGKRAEEEEIEYRKNELIRRAEKASDVSEANGEASKVGLTKAPNYHANSVVMKNKEGHHIRIIDASDIVLLEKEGFEIIVKEGKRVKSAPEKAAKKIRKPKGSGVRTMRGAIKAMGNINFLNFTGELKDMDTAIIYLSNKKSGVPIDDAITQLISDGWLEKGTTVSSFLESLRTEGVNFVKRGRIGVEISEKRKGELTEDEKRIKKEMEWEPETPPGRPEDYIQVRAEDLPEGVKLTLIEGKSRDGWDVYEVTEKDPFGVTLMDGQELELGPNDLIKVLKTDLPKTAVKPKGDVDMFGEKKPGQQEIFDVPKGEKAKKEKREKKEKPVAREAQVDLFTGKQDKQFEPELFPARKAQPEKPKTLDEAVASAKEVKPVIEFIAENSENESYREIANRILAFIGDVKFRVIEAGVTYEDKFPNALYGSLGLHWLRHKDGKVVKNEVLLKGKSFVKHGITEMTALHEALHAATSMRIKEGNLVKNKGTALFNSVSDLFKLQKAVVKELDSREKAGTATEFENSWLTRENVSSVDELVGNGFTDASFQKMLESIEYAPNQTAWSKFVDIIRRILGVKGDTALGELIRVTDEILSADMISTNEFSQSTKFSLNQAIQKITGNPNFVKWFGKSVVTDDKNNPEVFYHAGSFRLDEDEQFFIDDDGGIHFGTEDAARARIGGKAVDDAIQSIEVYENDDGTWNFEVDGIDHEGEYETKDEAYAEAEDFASQTDAGDDAYGDEALTEVYLSIKNPKKVADQGADWTEAITKAKKEGYDGIIYVNQFEDKGSLSYIAFAPTQIKSIFNTGAFSETDTRILHTYAGIEARGADESALRQAGWMESEGKDEEEIRRLTGWFLGPDDKWRWEINDSKSKLLIPNNIREYNDVFRKQIIDKYGPDYEMRLKDVWDNPELFKAYPEMKDKKVRIEVAMFKGEAAASYNDETDEIMIRLETPSSKDNIKISSGELKKTIGHEGMHVVQRIEGFARGGSPETAALNPEAYSGEIKSLLGELKTTELADKGDLGKLAKKYWGTGLRGKDWERLATLRKETPETAKILGRIKKAKGEMGTPMEVYRRLAGEIEARDVSARMDLTPAERAINFRKARKLAKAYNKTNQSQKMGEIENKLLALGYDIKSDQVYKALMGDTIAQRFLMPKPYVSQGIPKQDVIVRFGEGPQYSVTEESLTKGAENLEKDTLSILETAGAFFGKVGVRRDKKDLSYWGDLIVSIPEFFKKKIPAIRSMVNATYEKQDEMHEIIYNLETHEGTTVGGAFKSLKKQDQPGYKKVQNYLVESDRERIGYRLEYDEKAKKWRVKHPDTKLWVAEFDSAIDKDFFDTGEVQAAEASVRHEIEDLQGKGWTPQQANAVKAFRMSTNKGFFILTADMRRLKKRFADAKMTPPPISVHGAKETKKVSLNEAMAIIGDMRGYYFPRIRSRGGYVLRARKKGENPKLEIFKLPRGPIGKRKAELEKTGWTVEITESSQVGEDVFALSGELIKTQQIVNAALDKSASLLSRWIRLRLKEFTRKQKPFSLRHSQNRFPT